MGWAQLQSTHTKRELSPADSASLRGAVPTNRPSAALKSLVSPLDLGFRRRLELRTDFIGRPAPLLYPVCCPSYHEVPGDGIGLGIHSLSRLFPIAITRKVAAPQPHLPFQQSPNLQARLFLLPGNPGYPTQSVPTLPPQFLNTSPCSCSRLALIP